ncbi:MAG: hypothetical protein DK306_000850 [Chloroflexi bacterium]|nr:MAG: hypothetical protein DK306_000850 [Chloroflexota bacterium]
MTTTATQTARTYTLCDGAVLDLQGLDDEQRAYLEAAYRRAWPAINEEDAGKSRRRCEWGDFFNDVVGSKGSNPLLRATQGFVTREIYDHPFFQALSDLATRLGMRQGLLKRPRGKRWLVDPFADEFAPVSEIASRKSVTVKAVHKAIDRGDLVTVTGVLDGAGPKSGLLVSARSAKAWAPKRVKAAS